jgi:hypothetical protein
LKIGRDIFNNSGKGNRSPFFDLGKTGIDYQKGKYENDGID